MTRRPTFAQQLRRTRREAGVSQSDLARASGVNRAVISRYEAGKGTPEVANLVRLADALGVSADVLLGRAGYAKSKR